MLGLVAGQTTVLFEAREELVSQKRIAIPQQRIPARDRDPIETRDTFYADTVARILHADDRSKAKAVPEYNSAGAGP